MSTTKKIFDESIRSGVATPEQEAMLYDKGRITPENKMNISVRDIPASYLEQTPQPQDGQFGFVNQDVFGRPQRVKDELMKGQELGYQYSPFFSGQQYQEERISVADKLGLPETAGPEVWTAALNSDVTKNTYTVAGQAIRSVTAGVLGDLLSNTFGDLVSLGDSLFLEASRLGAHGLTYIGEIGMGKEWGKQKREQVNNNAKNAESFTQMLTGVDLTQHVSDFFWEMGDWYGSFDEDIKYDKALEEKFFTKDENGKIQISYKQFGKLQFWYTKVARLIPNIVAFAYGGAKFSRFAKTKAAATTFGAVNVAKPLNYVAGLTTKGINNSAKFFGSKGMGKAPKIIWKGKDFAGLAGGAMGGNMLEGVMLAGQAHRDALEMGASRDQAATAGFRTYVDNLAYLHVDAMKWLVMSKFVGGVGAKIKANSAGTFLPSFTELAVTSGLVYTDFRMEQIQETYQDWSAQRRAHQAVGKDFIIDGVNYQDDYWSYYSSEHAMETRVLSGAAALAPGSLAMVKPTANMFKELVNVTALRSSELDKKIENSGLTDSNDYNRVFARQAAKAKEMGLNPNEYTPDQKAMIEKELAQESFLLGIVSERGTEAGVAQLDQMVKEGKVDKEQAEQWKDTLNSMEETFKKHDNQTLKQLTPQARKQLAEIAYYKDSSERQLQELQEGKQAEIDSVNETIKDPKARKQQIDFINKEYKLAEDAHKETIQNYEKLIPQLYSDSKTFYENKIKEHKQKRQNKKAEVKKEQEKREATKIKKEQLKEKPKGKLRTSLNNLGYTDSEINTLTKKEANKIIKDKTKPNQYYKYKAVKNNKGTYDIIGPGGVVEATGLTKKAAETIAKNKQKGSRLASKSKVKSLEKEISNLATEFREETEKGNTKKAEAARKKMLKLHAEKVALQQGVNQKQAERSVDSAMKEKERNKGKEEKDTMDQTDKVKPSPVKYSKRYIAFEKAFRNKLKKKGINLVVFDSLMQTEEGLRRLGFVHGLSIFLDAGSATQETFFHENAHIYLGEFWNTPAVQALVDLIIKKDKDGKFINPLYENIKHDYLGKVLFSKKGKVFTFSQLLREGIPNLVTYSEWVNRAQNKGKTRAQYFKWAKTQMKGYKELSVEKQRYIQEEALADLMGKKLDEQDLDKKIVKKEQEKTKNAIRRFWDFLKNIFTKKEAKEILEKTGHDKLSQDLDSAVENVVKDYKNKDGYYYSTRATRASDIASNYETLEHLDRTPSINSRVSKQLDNEINNLKSEDYIEEINRSPYREDGKPTPAGKRKAKQFILDNQRTLKALLKNYYQVSMDQEAIDHLDNNWTSLLNQSLRNQISTNVELLSENQQDEFESDTEMGTMDAYIDNKRSGEGEGLSNAINEYSMFEEIDGKKMGSKEVRKILYTIGWGNRDFKNFKTKANEALLNLKFNRDQSNEMRVFGRFINLLTEIYTDTKYEGPNKNMIDNVIQDLHHELNGMKRIDYHISYFSNGKLQIKRHGAASKNIIQNDIVNRINGFLTIPVNNTPNSNSVYSGQERYKIKFLSRLGGLNTLVNSDKSLSEKRKGIASFIHSNLVPSNYRESISPAEIETMEIVDEFIPTEENPGLVSELIKDVGVFIFDGRRPKNVDAQINSAIKGLTTKLSKENFTNTEIKNLKSLIQYSKENNTYENKNIFPRVNLSLKNGNIEFASTRIKKQVHPYGAVKKIVNSISATISLGEFDSQTRMPAGEKTNLLSKKHQVDFLLEKIENMSQEDFAIFGDNKIAQAMRDGKIKPEDVVQMIGGIVNGNAYNAGFETSNQRTMMDIAEIANAIVSKQRGSYSQSVSILSDKTMQLRINNVPILSFNEAWTEAENISNKGDRFLKNKEGETLEVFDLYDKSKTKLKQEVLKLEKFIASQPLDLISNDIKTKMNGDRSAYLNFLSVIVLNYAVNKHHAKDLLIGPAKHFSGPNDYIKRAAGSVAMHMQWDSDSRIEPIMLKDVKVDGVNKTDACTFITESMAKRMVEQKYGGIRKVGKHYKFVYNGQNLDNKTFAKTAGERFPFYGKTNVFILNKDFLAKNPGFESLNTALELRDNATPGNVMPIAMFDSAIKNQSTGLSNSLISVDKLASFNENNGELLNKHQDNLFKDEDTYGLDGSFFGVQTELDKQSTSSTIAKQILFHLNSIPADIKNSSNVQQLFVEAFKSKVDEVLNQHFISGELTDVKIKKVSEKLAKEADTNIFAQAAIDLLAIGSFDNGSIELRRKLSQSLLKKRGLRMRGKGGITYQSTDFGVGTNVNLNNVSTNEKLGLKPYRKVGNKYEPAEIAIHENLIPGVDAETLIGKRLVLQRVPASKLGDAVVGKVTQIIRKSGSMVMIPSQMSDIIGSDLDGDALHVLAEHQGDKLTDSQQKYNKAINSMMNLMLSDKYHTYMSKSIDFGGVVRQAKNEINNTKGVEYTKSDINDLSIVNDNKKFRSNREGNKNIGKAALFNTLYKVLSSYGLSTKGNASVNNQIVKVKNGKQVRLRIDNNYQGKDGRGFNLAYLLNIFLDDANKGNASELNMNEHTFTSWSQLLSKGVPFSDASIIMNAPVAKEYVELLQNNPNMKNFDAVRTILKKMGITEPIFKLSAAPISLNNINNKNSRIGVLQLMSTLGNKKLQNNLRTLGDLSNLDSSLPKTSTGVKDLIRKAIGLSYDGNKEVVINVGNLFNKKISKKELQEFEKDLRLGNVNSILNNVKFNHPLLQRNFEILLKQANVANSDPAYAGGWSSIIEKIIPFNSSDFNFISEEEIIKMENTVRAVRLAQEKTLYNFNLTGVFEDAYSKNEKVMDALTKDTTSYESILHFGISHLEQMADGGQYSFIQDFLDIKTLDTATVRESTGKATSIAIKNGKLIAKGIKVKDLKQNKRVSPNSRAISNPVEARKAFEKLPKSAQDFLLAYDLAMNGHHGPNALLPYLGNKAAKVSNATKQQLTSSERQLSLKGKLTQPYVNAIAEYVMVNNKNINNSVFIDESFKVEGNKIVRDNTEGVSISHNSIVSVQALSNNGKSISVLYKAEVNKETDKVTLRPIAPSFTKDKRMPTKIDVQQQRDKSIESDETTIVGDEVFSQVETRINHKTIGEVDGVEIKDDDGLYAMDERYQSEEERYYNVKKPILNEQEYANQFVGTHVNLNKLKEEDKQSYNKLMESFVKYQQDVDKIAILEETYFTKNDTGVVSIDSSEFSIDDVLSILKNEVNLLDPVATADIREKMSRALGAKMHLATIQQVLKAAKDQGFTQQQVDALLDIQQKLQVGDKLSSNDISWVQMWVDANISSAQRGEISFILNDLNKSEMHHNKELRRIRRKINKSYDKLLKSRLKFFKGIPWFVHKFIHGYVPYGRLFYNKFVFGNLIEEVEGVDSKTGRYYRSIRLRDFTSTNGTVSAQKMKDAGLTEAEIEYYKMYVETTTMFENHLAQKMGPNGKPLLEDGRGPTYIPNMPASKFEMMINRNMTAAYIGHNYDAKLRNIHVVGMIDGVSTTAPLGHFIEHYKVKQYEQGKGSQDFRSRREIKRLMNQANRYVKSGVDANGNAVILSDDIVDISNGHTFNRSLSARSTSAEFSASFDIHGNLDKYVRKNLWMHGLDSQSGFSFKGFQEKLPLIDAAISYNSFKDQPYAARWIRELLKDKFILQKGRKSIFTKDGKRHWADNIFDNLQKWTMLIGLGMNVTAAVGNVAIGKYNSFRRGGIKGWARGESRFFGIGQGGVYNNEARRKATAIAVEFGVITDAVDQSTEGLFEGGFGKIMFMPMSVSEKWIQRVGFVGQLTNEEFNSFTVNEEGEIVVIDSEVYEQLTKNADQYKSDVYGVQGRGYTALDQRLMQNYSLLTNILQFKRWFPTFISDRWGGEKIDRFNRGQIGASRATVSFIRDIVKDGEVDVRKWRGRFENLPKARQEAIARAYRGTLGMVVVLGLMTMAAGDDDEQSGTHKELQDLFWDMCLLMNVDRIEYLMGMPSIDTGLNILHGIKHVTTGAKYQRDSKYGKKGESKAKGVVPRLFPKPVRRYFQRELD